MNKNLLVLTILLNTVIAGQLESGVLSALLNDNSFKANQAKYNAVLKNQDIIMDSLKPHVGATTGIAREKYSASGSNNIERSDTFTSHNLSIKLEQRLFDVEAYENYKLSEIQADKAAVDLNISKQELILNVASQYLDVLKSYAIYEAAISQEQALSLQKQYDLSKFKAGAITESDLLETSAKYDSSIAYGIEMKSNLYDAVNLYKSTTKINSPKFMRLKDDFVPHRKNKTKINDKISLLKKHNLELKSATLYSYAVRKEIDVDKSKHLPTIKLSGLYSDSHVPNSVISTYTNIEETESKNISVNFELPIYEGGAVNDQIIKTKYKYEKSQAELDQVKSDLILSLRKTHHHLLAGEKQISALLNSVISSKSSVKAQRNGYEAGTRTNLELLSAISQLRDSQSQYAITRYDYLKNQLLERKLTGELNFDDITELDKILAHTVNLPLENA